MPSAGGSEPPTSGTHPAATGWVPTIMPLGGRPCPQRDETHRGCPRRAPGASRGTARENRGPWRAWEAGCRCGPGPRSPGSTPGRTRRRRRRTRDGCRRGVRSVAGRGREGARRAVVRPGLRNGPPHSGHRPHHQDSPGHTANTGDPHNHGRVQDDHPRPAPARRPPRRSPHKQHHSGESPTRPAPDPSSQRRTCRTPRDAAGRATTTSHGPGRPLRTPETSLRDPRPAGAARRGTWSQSNHKVTTTAMGQ